MALLAEERLQEEYRAEMANMVRSNSEGIRVLVCEQVEEVHMDGSV